ncbi:MAG TPA: DNA damage-inducible protein D [Methylomirabilota bacterium]|jgi:DNA-damage-inducible protein D|nr:DNA damage-inducible protein D [Methylomirabilota bacterium]
MDEKLSPQTPLPMLDFESLKQIDENKVEFWMARKLMPLLGYDNWPRADRVIRKAAKACLNSGEEVENHFSQINTIVPINKNTVKKVPDYKLDRYACYLIAQNGNSNNPEIATAQSYFAMQVRLQEIYRQKVKDEKRLNVRNEVKTQNKKLASTAQRAGVTNFGNFNDAGYWGLYGMPLGFIENKKGLKKGELLDRAGTTELAANLFRITQTNEKMKKEQIKGDRNAMWAHNMIGGKIRQTMKEIGSTLPEDLPPEKHIKELNKNLRKQLKK